MKRTVLSVLIFFAIIVNYAQAETNGLVTRRFINRNIKEFIVLKDNKEFARYEINRGGNIYKLSGGDLSDRLKVRHENGRLAAEMDLNNGEVNGLVKFFYKDQRIEAEYNYKDSRRDGNFRVYYDTGLLQQTGLLKPPVLENNHKKRTAAEELDIQDIQRRGVLIRLTGLNGDTFISQEDIKQEYSKPEGEVRSYDRMGVLEYIDIYKDGELIKTQAYDPAGAVKWERDYTKR